MSYRRLFPILFCFLLHGLAAPAVFSEEPWEAAALKGVATMNNGDGKTFVANAHTEFKIHARKMIVEKVEQAPTSFQSKLVCKDFGASDLEGLKKVPLDQFVEMLIPLMQQSLSPEIQASYLAAKLKVTGSEPLSTGEYRVSVEMQYDFKGKPITTTTVHFVKWEGGTWKYNGDSESHGK